MLYNAFQQILVPAQITGYMVECIVHSHTCSFDTLSLHNKYSRHTTCPLNAAWCNRVSPPASGTVSETPPSSINHLRHSTWPPYRITLQWALNRMFYSRSYVKNDINVVILNHCFSTTNFSEFFFQIFLPLSPLPLSLSPLSLIIMYYELC